MLANFRHEVNHKVQIMNRGQRASLHFLRAEEVREIGASIIFTGITIIMFSTIKHHELE